MSIATLLSQHHQVTAVDIVPEKVEMINNRKSPIQDDYIEKYLAEKELNLTATLDAKAAYSDADFVVIAAPTNYDSHTQHFDTSAVEAVIKLVMEYNPDAIMVIKSTIPVGYTASVREKFGSKNIIFSPEFLRERCVHSAITASPSRTEERSCISMSKLERIIHDNSNGLDYILVGEIYLPLIAVPEEKREIGFYGSLHRNYLKDYKSGLYSYLTLSGKLWTYLADLNEQCLERRDFLMEQIMEQEGITEELKSRDQMEWVRRANNARSRVDEIILNELVYV